MASPSSATPTWPAGWPGKSRRCIRTTCCAWTEDLCKAKDGNIDVNLEDDAIRGLTVIKGASSPGRTAAQAAGRAADRPKAERTIAEKKWGHGHGAGAPMPVKSLAIVFGVGALLFLLVGLYAPRLPRALHRVRAGLLRRLHGGVERHASLHTPLMSVTNAISSSSPSGAGADRPPLADGARRLIGPGLAGSPSSASC